MFLVHQARDVMDRDIVLLQATTSFDTFLRQPEHKGKIPTLFRGLGCEKGASFRSSRSHLRATELAP